MLARFFADEYAAKNGTPVSPIDARALERLVSHAWPGNVRELKNSIERSALLAAGRPILPEQLPLEVQKGEGVVVSAVPDVASADVVQLPVGMTMDHAEREMIR